METLSTGREEPHPFACFSVITNRTEMMRLCSLRLYHHPTSPQPATHRPAQPFGYLCLSSPFFFRTCTCTYTPPQVIPLSKKFPFPLLPRFHSYPLSERTKGRSGQHLCPHVCEMQWASTGPSVVLMFFVYAVVGVLDTEEQRPACACALGVSVGGGGVCPCRCSYYLHILPLPLSPTAHPPPPFPPSRLLSCALLQQTEWAGWSAGCLATLVILNAT